MLATSICIGLNNKENYEVTDINGNRETLGNVNIVYQQDKGYYKTTEVIISKDKTKVDNYAKGATIGLPLNNFYKQNRDLINYSKGEYSTYKDDISIGYANVESHYNMNNEQQLIVSLKDKNLETNKIKSYEIPLGDKFNQGSNLDYRGIPLKYNGELYIIVGLNKDGNFPFGEEANVYASKECLVNIYKLNLKNEKSELVASRIIGKKDDLASIGNEFFTYKNEFYFTKESYEKISEKEYKKKYELISYDLKTKKFNSTNIPTESSSENDDITKTYIEGDKVSFLSYNNKSSELSMKISSMDLKSKKFIAKNENYILKLSKEKFDHNIQQIRDIDNKLYIIIEAYENSEKVKTREPLNKAYIYVIDKTTKKNLYTGIVKDESTSYIHTSIVTNDEL
jgi:hypothetical protein